MKLLALLAAGTFVLSAGAAGPRPAPKIAGEDPITGKQVSLSSFAGRVVVVNVWASWCTGCQYEHAQLLSFSRRHPDVQLLGVDYGDVRARARASYKAWRWTWPTVWDPTGKWRDALRAPGLPTTIFLNRRHQIVGGIVGTGTLKQFEAGLRIARER